MTIVVLPNAQVQSAQVPNSGSLIAIVDDDESVRNAIERLMRAMGFAVEVFSSAEDFLRSADVSRAACLVADVNMPNMSGLDLHQNLLLQGNAIPTVLITAYPSDNDHARAIQAARPLLSYKAFRGGRSAELYPRRSAWWESARRHTLMLA